MGKHKIAVTKAQNSSMKNHYNPHADWSNK